MYKRRREIEFSDFKYRYTSVMDRLNKDKANFKYVNGLVVAKGYRNMKLEEFKEMVIQIENMGVKYV